MTIRTGELHLIESLSQFKERLRVDNKEIIQALPGQAQEKLVSHENEARNNIGNAEPIAPDELGEIHRDTLNDFLIKYGLGKIILNVLESRDQDYTHIRESSTHRIVELTPK